ncbi:GL13197 [Drosophila persimilis]|uniref:GL13197 n=1 Tax=Drosophila persimilis TaxID=7234 RepID=B4HCX0_DROPE|nr:GL13197 [Drosophila persimilis]
MNRNGRRSFLFILPLDYNRGGSGSGGGGGGGGGAGGGSDISKDHCNKTVDIFEDISSPEVSNQNVGRPLTCWYRFRTLKGAPRDFVLRLRFKKFKVGQLLNATHCEGGYLQIVDGNAKTDVSNRREPGMFCGEAEQPQTFISETSYVKVLFHTDNFTDQVSPSVSL